jgi:serine/threonine protein kinase
VAAALAKLLVPKWRPSERLGIPHRKHWVLQRKLGQGGFGETWLAEHANTHERRVFKFCSDVGKLKAFQREITLFRFMRETLGGRDDIAAVLDWQLDEPPYFIESEFGLTENLVEWLRGEGGAQAVPLDDRIDVVRRIAVALTAAHSVGVLHKDVKPANVLVGRTLEGLLRVRLCDFGISVVTDEARLRDAGVTGTGITLGYGEARTPDSGTRLYMAPELIEGKPPTTSAAGIATWLTTCFAKISQRQSKAPRNGGSARRNWPSAWDPFRSALRWTVPNRNPANAHTRCSRQLDADGTGRRWCLVGCSFWGLDSDWPSSGRRAPRVRRSSIRLSAATRP